MTETPYSQLPVRIFTVALFFTITALVVIPIPARNPADAHFFGKTITVGDYQVIFQPYPAVPAAGQKGTTLNFSILQDSDNVPVFASVSVTEKNSAKLVYSTPYRLYEFSDITIPYVFENNTDYIISIQAKINGDQQYQEKPLVASFPITVGATDAYPPFDQIVLYYVLPPVVAIVGVIIYLDYRKKGSIIR